MTCSACGDKPKKTSCEFPRAIVEIDNAEQISLFRKVVVPTSMGDDTTVPPTIGKYHNVLLNYEANNHTYIYSSDGIPTLLTSDVAETIEQRVKDLEVTVADEIDTREKADNNLQTQIDTKADASSLSAVATSGNYNDLTNKPTIGDATLTIQRNSTDVGTFTANSTTDATIDISVPTTPADIGAQAEITSDNKLDADLVDDTNATNKFVTAADLSKISTALQPADIDKVVMTDIDVSGNTSTTTVALEAAKENLMSGAQTTKSIALPVASTTEAGVMNSATFDAVTSNTNNINALLNGAVAVTGLSASPSQSDITTAWQTETGLTTLINRASVYDVTNDKVWTYYTNDTTWHAASNTTQVTINTFTNSSEGTIKGSTNTGQIFAESDGTGSVNGWDALNAQVSDNTNNIGTLQTAITNKQDKLTAGSNITISSNTISATDTTYTAGTGLTLAGTQFSADTSVLQEKLTAGNAIDITSNVISADIYPADYFTAGATVTDTGSKITLNNTIAAPLIDVDLYGDTEQKTYTGKNLLPPPANGTRTSGGVEFTVTNSTITGTGTVSAVPPSMFDTVDLPSTLPSGTYTFSIPESNTYKIGIILVDGNGTAHSEDALSIPAGDTSVTITTTYTIAKYRLSVRGVPVGQSVNFSMKNEFQLETGSTPTAIEPYVGSMPAPSPDYPQDIHVVTGEQTVNITGKNLFNFNNGTTVLNASSIGKVTMNLTNNSIKLTTDADSSSSIYSNTDFELDTTKTYIVSGKAKKLVGGTGGTPGLRVTLVGSNDGITWTAATSVYDNTTPAIDTEYSFNYTFSANYKYYRFRFYNNTASHSSIGESDIYYDLQLEEGSTPTSYQPYQSQSYTVDLDSIELAKIGTHQDYIYKSGDDWYIHKETGKLVADGSEEGWNSSAVSGGRQFYISIQGISMVSPRIIACDNFYYITGSTAENTTYINSSGLWVIYKPTSNGSPVATSTAEFQTWLSTHNTTMYYALATPTDTKIIDADLISDLDALANANSYIDTTYFTVTATSSNLPALLAPTVYRYSAAGVAEVLGVMPDRQVQSDWTQVDTTAVDYIKNKPTLATVATTGDYDDLVDKPALATVATSGSYSDLTNKPTIPAAQVNSDWNANSGIAQILNKPSLATVATSGSYTDLSNKPTIPAAQIQSDWTQTNTVAKDYIKNKPVIPDVGEMKELTSADYDYPTANPSGVALWALDTGIYYCRNGVKCYTSSSNYYSGSDRLFIIGPASATVRSITIIQYTGVIEIMAVAINGGSEYNRSFVLTRKDLQDNLTTTVSGQYALDAAQGKVLNDKIPVITMQTTDPGEGQPLADNNFIGVYQ